TGNFNRVSGSLEAPGAKAPGTRHGECAHAPATVRDWPGLAVDRPARPARYSGARIGPGPPVRETAARVAHFALGRWPGAVGSITACCPSDSLSSAGCRTGGTSGAPGSAQ